MTTPTQHSGQSGSMQKQGQTGPATDKSATNSQNQTQNPREDDADETTPPETEIGDPVPLEKRKIEANESSGDATERDEGETGEDEDLPSSDTQH